MTNTRLPTWRRVRVVGVVALGSVAVLALAACSPTKPTAAGTGGAVGRSTGPTSATPSPTTPPAQLTFTPAAGSQNVNPITPVTVSAALGRLTTVTLSGPDGAPVPGTLDATAHTWTSTAPLAYATQYSMSTVAANADGTPATTMQAFTTLKPGNMTLPYINTASGYSIQDGSTYGVGQVLDIRWDEKIADRAAAQKAVTVTTDPPQPAAFDWTGDQDMMWRTKDYLTPGTKVTIAANVFGVQVGDSLWGQKNVSTSFVVGDSHVSVADDATKTVTVYANGQVVHTMKTSMGQGGYVKASTGETISLYTNSGPHIVIEKAADVHMTSSSFGLPKTDPLGYDTNVKWGVKISNDGEYLHAAPWNHELGVRDESHGCLNLSTTDALWMFNFSVPGDIVDVKGTPQQLQSWNSGSWTVPWDRWVAGSAVPVS